MNYTDMGFAKVAQLPGVKDIQPVAARAKFANALMAEAVGDHETAEQRLNEACELA